MRDPISDSALRHKNRLYAQTRAQRFFDQLRPFDADERAGPAAGRAERLPQLFQARILFAFDDADRHSGQPRAILTRVCGVGFIRRWRGSKIHGFFPPLPHIDYG